MSAETDDARKVKAEALALGFDACAIAQAGPADPDGNLARWLELGYHADMRWMESSRETREDVSRKVAGARSVIMVARNYYSERPHSEPGCGKVARYAWGRDYHRVLRKPLRRLAARVQALCPDTSVHCSVDSGPVLERTWAERAGLGSIGKNSLVLNRELGSWFFLGAIITTARLAADPPTGDICGTCTRCIDACPTAAIVAPRIVDSNRCISYHTIENRGEVPPAIADASGDWVFGCDICQEVCPWNRFATLTTEPDFLPRPGQANPGLETLASLEDEAFKARFEGSAVRRARGAGMRRNAGIAISNREML